MQRNPNDFSPPVIEGLTEFQWNIFVDEMKRVWVVFNNTKFTANNIVA